ncbi:MAG: aminoglycoside phosphotransferase family protein [Oscillospiraceae bacterium]|nr:aminoglycoside phosphotransferase family protein [Oscillospiraceae bacterium]
MHLGEPIQKGNTAGIYLHDGKIIKVLNDNLRDTEAEYEANKQKYAYSRGLPVPYVYGVVPVNGRQAIVMEHITGRTVGDMLYEDMTKAHEYMNISVDVQLKIHAVHAADFERMTDKLERQLLSARFINDKQKKTLIERMYAIQHENHLCHGDYHIFNLILNDHQVTIIDWVDASSGDLRADVYRSYLLYVQFSQDFADLYLRLYCETSGISQDEIFVWAPVIAGARLSENISPEEANLLLDIVNHDPK